MTSALVQLATLVVLGGAALGTGLLLATTVGLRRLRHVDATAAAASTALGVCAWTVGFSFLSGVADLPAGSALAFLVAGQAGLLVVAWKRRAAAPLEVRGPAIDWVLLGGALLVTATLALLPVLRYESFRAGNDTYTYCALAEWLQHHGFGEIGSGTAGSQVTGIAALYQRRFPLGAAYPLALARAAELGPGTLSVYPAVSALGLILTVCALWWMTRRALRLGRPAVAATLAVFALAPHAAYWAHHNGFLSQTYAVSGLLLGLAALAAPRGIADRLGLLSFSLAAAFLYVVYLPFLILLAAGALAHSLSDLARARREGRFRRALVDWGRALALPLVLVGLNLTPVLRGVPILMRSNTVGGHIGLGPGGFAAIALGPGPGPFAGWPRWTEPGTGPLTLAAAVLVAIGVRALWPQRRGVGMLAASVVLAGLLVKYGLFAQDPWSGERGQTWFVFKTTQWIFPLALVLQAAGLGQLRRHQRSLAALVLVAAVSLVPAHAPWSRRLGLGTRIAASREAPLADLDGLLKRFRDLPPGKLVLLGLPDRVSPFRGRYAQLFAYPRSISVDRDGLQLRPGLRAIRLGDVVPLLGEAPPFDREDRTDLGGGFALLTAVDRPRLVQVTARLGAVGEPERGGVVLPLVRTRTKLLVLAPRPEPVELTLRIEPAAGRDTSVVECRIVSGAISGSTYKQAVRNVPPQRLAIVRGSVTVVRFEAETGLNAVVLTSEGPPQGLKDVVLREGTSPGRDAP